MKRDLLIFDMDGVLVDVSQSYRETIRQTVEHFTGKPLHNERIQEKKNEGGWNDDWALSFHLVSEARPGVTYNEVVTHFQTLFRGSGGAGGLIQRERWIAQGGLLDRLTAASTLAIFTGRLQEEAGVTLARFAPNLFDPIVGSDNVTHTKPHPEGLHQIRERVVHERVFYMGDTVDDARSALAAGVPFIGIVGPETPRRGESVTVLNRHGAIAVLETINQIEEVLSTR